MEARLAWLEHETAGKSLKWDQNSVYLYLIRVMKWSNDQGNTCPHNHLLVAYATPKKAAENPDFIRLSGQSLTKLAIVFAVFRMLLDRIGRQFVMRLQFVQKTLALPEIVVSPHSFTAVENLSWMS